MAVRRSLASITIVQQLNQMWIILLSTKKLEGSLTLSAQNLMNADACMCERAHGSYDFQ